MQINSVIGLLPKLSLTLHLAKCLKKYISSKIFQEKSDSDCTHREIITAVKKGRSSLIKKLNLIYLLVAIISCTLISIVQYISEGHEKIYFNPFFVVFWCIVLFSRVHEIFCAFLLDAFDTLNNRVKSSSLSNASRLELSLRSYIELILNFSLFYYIVPESFWKDCESVGGISESIYFSGVTITTLGYGDITPINPLVQIVTVYEVLCGFTLLIISFSMYTSKASRCS